MDASSVEYRCERLLIEPGRKAVLRYVVPAARRLEGTDLVIPAGVVTVGHFWVDRPYNAYRFTAGGRTLALYCSIATETRIADDLVEYLDLAVDVLITPDGTATVLDEEEVPRDLDPKHRRTIAEAIERILSAPRGLLKEVEGETRTIVL